MTPASSFLPETRPPSMIRTRGSITRSRTSPRRFQSKILRDCLTESVFRQSSSPVTAASLFTRAHSRYRSRANQGISNANSPSQDSIPDRPIITTLQPVRDGRYRKVDDLRPSRGIQSTGRAGLPNALAAATETYSVESSIEQSPADKV